MNEMDKKVLAECKHNCTSRNISFRTLKNHWPICPVCKQPLIVRPTKPLLKEDQDEDADSVNSTPD
jgi:hypothetical protein